MSALKRRTQDREDIRLAACAVSQDGDQSIPFEDQGARVGVDMLEQLVLAVCNLAETVDALKEDPLP